jgi:putative FmdB family regulatory protein
MPTYSYRCTKCGTEYEVVRSMSDPAPKRCKKCRGLLRRTFHPVGIVLKGSGFYKTDHRSKPGKSAADGEKAVSTESTDSPASSSEGKETKTEKKEDTKASDKKTSAKD